MQRTTTVLEEFQTFWNRMDQIWKPFKLPFGSHSPQKERLPSSGINVSKGDFGGDEQEGPNKEVEGTSSYILSLENNSVKRQINEEKKNIDLLQLENEKINAQVIQTNEEFVRVQQNILNASEIDEQLKVYVTSTKNRSIYIQESFREKFNKSLDEKTAIESSINTKALYLEGLRKKINDFKSQCGSTDKKDENLLLKSECVDKREYSIKLKKLVENLKRNCETNIEILPLTTELAEKNEKIIELSNDINTTTVEKTKKINEVNENLVDITNRIDSTKERITAINLKLTENSEIKKELQKELEINQQTLSKNEIEINKLEDEKIEKENKLFELSEQHTSKINVLKYDLNILENEVCTLKEENNKKVKAVSLNNFFAKYFEKMAEKNVLNDKKVALEKIQLLETEINTEETNIKNAEIELEEITYNPLLVDLTKKKDFLDACKIYFSDQMENIKKEHSEVKQRVQEATGDVNRLTKSIEEKKTEKNRYRTLKRKHSKKDKINSTLVSVSSSTQDIEKDFNLPTSILKKKPQFTTPFSPKKVQFANLSSTESSGLTRTIEEVTDLDKVLENFRKMPKQQSSKQELNKRRVFFD
ncbi:unnamed protein product [Psylliodes chrysocephalus]|uniref:Uncharacterized protein n=1 Tax=Psylliodes chrysocephalus TaxID=3402493 RepID=A0A9P0G9T2_9CUCU|nr:unnamed protein product [Psylliodes chrysocephala]